MKIFLLHSSLLYKYPEILSLKSDEFEFWIPKYYGDGYSTILGTYYDFLLKTQYEFRTVNDFDDYKNISTDKDPNLVNFFNSEKFDHYSYITEHTDLLHYAMKILLKNENEIFICHYNENIFKKKQLAEIGIKIIEYDALISEINKTEHTKIEQITTEALKLRTRNQKERFFDDKMPLLMLITAFFFIVNTIFEFFKIDFFNWIYIIVFSAAPFILYWYRANYRIGYSIFEIIFGFATLINTFISAYKSNLDLLKISFLIPIGASIYIIIRGFDNFEKGIESNYNYIYIYEIWKRIFGNKNKKI